MATKNRAAVSLGRRGGKSKSYLKRAKVALNGLKGGRPRKRLEQAGIDAPADTEKVENIGGQT